MTHGVLAQRSPVTFCFCLRRANGPRNHALQEAVARDQRVEQHRTHVGKKARNERYARIGAAHGRLTLQQAKEVPYPAPGLLRWHEQKYLYREQFSSGAVPQVIDSVVDGRVKFVIRDVADLRGSSA